MRTVTPLAALGQKKMESDTRQCFLAVEGRGWAITESVPTDQEGEARTFAARVNAAAREVDAFAAEPGAMDIAEQLEMLASLKDRGILTDEEFLSKKAELLARM